MNAIYCGRNRSGNRVLVQTDYGYIGAEAIDDCEFAKGEAIQGVTRDHGTQHWRGAGGSRCEVYVEGFDGGREWAVRWLNGG
jgi:hypothetical protein